MVRIRGSGGDLQETHGIRYGFQPTCYRTQTLGRLEGGSERKTSELEWESGGRPISRSSLSVDGDAPLLTESGGCVTDRNMYRRFQEAFRW